MRWSWRSSGRLLQCLHHRWAQADAALGEAAVNSLEWIISSLGHWLKRVAEHGKLVMTCLGTTLQEMRFIADGHA